MPRRWVRRGRQVLLAGLGLVPVAAVALDGPGLERCKDSLAAQVAAHGVGAATFVRHVRPVAADPSVLSLLDHQPEFGLSVADYLAPLVDAERLADGRSRLAEHRALLDRLERHHGVPAGVVVSIWGIETDYGRHLGRRPLLQSLTTLACAGRRQAFFRGELWALLRLLQSGELRQSDPVGSWAGAFGHTQFIPSTYARVAIDGDGDGRRDLVDSVPDALASTARYLQLAGWKAGQPWGVPVRLPAGKAPGPGKRPLAQWRRLGVLAADGGEAAPSLPGSEPATLWLPAGAAGPAYLTFGNFQALLAYNNSRRYALAVGLLADGLARGALQLPAWPLADPPLDRAGIRALQALLRERGHVDVAVDGLAGSATRRAIASEQRRLGWQPVDGRAGSRILATLQRSRALAGQGEAGAMPSSAPRPLPPSAH